MFYISISNGLLEDEHQMKMGAAVWQFMWLIDKVTKVDDEGYGWILGGKPIQLKDFGNCLSEKQISRNLQKLKKEGYITIRRTPYGLVIKVVKAKKRFHKSVSSGTDENVLSEGQECPISGTKMSDVIKTVSVDNTEDKVEDTAQSAEDKIIPLFIDLFKEINPTYQRLFGLPPQRQASKRLLKLRTLEEWQKVIKFIASRRTDRFCPRISTPIQLEAKYADLETYAAGLKSQAVTNQANIAFTS